MLCFSFETTHARVNLALALVYFLAGFSFFITMFMPESKTGCFDVDNSLWLGGGYLVFFSVLIFFFAWRAEKDFFPSTKVFETFLMIITFIVLCTIDIIFIVNLVALSSNEDTACIQKSNNPLIVSMLVFTVPLLLYSAFYFLIAVIQNKLTSGGDSSFYTNAEFQTLLL